MTKVIPELKYWKTGDGPDTAIWHRRLEDRYITFELDVGGLNNKRISFEHIATVAALTGRTLVLPPPEPWHLINSGPGSSQSEQDQCSRFDDVFDIDGLQEFVPVLSTSGFIGREGARLGIPADLKNTDPDLLDSQNQQSFSTTWKKWLRAHTTLVNWNPQQHLLCYPSVDALVGNGLDVNSDYVAGRRLVEYESALQSARVIHFPMHLDQHQRMFGQILAMVAFQYPEMYRLHRRFIKQSVRYAPTIFEIASGIIRSLGPSMYDSLHVRRNDFYQQFSSSHVGADRILASITNTLKKNSTLYIATDETDSSYFRDISGRFTVKRLVDVLPDKEGFPSLLTGPVEQLICACSKTFVGTQYSTFSQYINRLRCFIQSQDTSVRYHNLYESPSVPFSGTPLNGLDWSHEGIEYWSNC